MVDTVLEVFPEDVCGSVSVSGRRIWLFNSPLNDGPLEVGVEGDGDIWIINDSGNEATLFGANGDPRIQYSGAYQAFRYDTPGQNDLERDGTLIEAPAGLVAAGAEVGDNIGTDSASIVLDSIPDEDQPPSRLNAGVLPGGLLPDSICQGVSPSIEVGIGNVGICEGISVEMELVNRLTDERTVRSFNIRPGELREREFTIEIPESATIGTATFYEINFTSDAIENPENSVVQEGQILEQANMQLDRIERPDSVCVGSRFNVAAIIRNLGDCASQVRARFESTETGQATVTDPVTIAGDGEQPLEFIDTVPEELLDIGTAPIEIDVEHKVGGSFEPLASRTVDIGISEPTVDVLE